MIGMMPLAIGLLATWGTYAVLSANTPQTPAAPSPQTDARPVTPAQPARPKAPLLFGTAGVAGGPWGRLEILPITISPPLDYMGDDLRTPPREVVWYFACTSQPQLAEMLRQAGLTESLQAKLLALAQPNDKKPTFYKIKPDRQLVLSLSREDRAKLYLVLHDYEGNLDQRNAYRFPVHSRDEWFHDSLVSPEVEKLVTPLIYRQGGLLFFADRTTIWSDVTSPEQRAWLAKTLARQRTMLIKVKLSADTDVDALVNYWGRGGRAKDVRPLIESLTQLHSEQGLDITHLLPAFARRRIYTYPTPPPMKRKADQDCHWTAMNFFNDQPEDRFGIAETTLATFNEDYYHVSGNPQLGDLVVFMDRKGVPVHSAVYIAADILFTKNGKGLTPWVFDTLENMKDYYPRPLGLGITYFRRKGI